MSRFLMCSGSKDPSGRRLGCSLERVLTSWGIALGGRVAEHNIDRVSKVSIVAYEYVCQITNEQGAWHISQTIELTPLANR